MKSKIIAIVNQKGGVGKTTTTFNLGTALNKKGHRVLMVDFDPQSNLSVYAGVEPSEDGKTVKTAMENIINEEALDEGIIIQLKDGLDLVPSSNDLAGAERVLSSVSNGKKILRLYLDSLRDAYEFILIDCGPTLGELSVNALVAADSVLVPVKAEYLSIIGCEQLMNSIIRTRNHLNRTLTIEGILLTMANTRTRSFRDLNELLRDTFRGKFKVYDTVIPLSVKAADSAMYGKSVIDYAPRSRVSGAYIALAAEFSKVTNQVDTTTT